MEYSRQNRRKLGFIAHFAYQNEPISLQWGKISDSKLAKAAKMVRNNQNHQNDPNSPKSEKIFKNDQNRVRS